MEIEYLANFVLQILGIPEADLFGAGSPLDFRTKEGQQEKRQHHQGQEVTGSQEAHTALDTFG